MTLQVSLAENIMQSVSAREYLHLDTHRSVFDRALSVQFLMFMSCAQDGINPKRLVVKWRDFLVCSLRTVRTGCVGAVLCRGHS
jgi:hypothetical protein